MKNLKLSKVQKKRLASIVSGALLFVCGILLSVFRLSTAADISFVLAGASAGAMCVTRSVKGIMRRSFFDENTLMTVAAIGAVLTGEYPECAAVMILYQTGELFQSLAVGKSRRAIAELGKLCPDTAYLEKDGEYIEIPASEASEGDIIRIRAGERIPTDCIIISGSTAVDTSPVTGESLPLECNAGDTLYSGCMNISGLIRAKVIRPASDSAAARILKLTEEASDRKTASEAFITKFARVYTPTVCILALLTAFGGPLVIQLLGGSFSAAFPEWGRKALTMLVISCPCALVISVPLGYFCGLGKASSMGILIKGSAFIDTLAKADCAMFDKTGTLTEGKLTISGIEAGSVSEARLLQLAASAEANSSHPIARAICEANTEPQLEVVSSGELPGRGVEAELADGCTVSVIKPEASSAATAAEVLLNGSSVGTVYFSDTLKPASKQALARLKQAGIKETVILTGDSAGEGERIRLLSGADTVYSRLLPEEKLEHIENACKTKTVIYAGDGINDSPALARADVGVAMGALGSEAAIEAADVVLMDSNPLRLAEAVVLAKKTLFAVRTNIVTSLAVKLSVLVLSALSLVGMWGAVLADVGVCIVCVSNSVRLLRKK